MRSFLLALALAVCAATAEAQSVGQTLLNVGNDMKYLWTAPARTDGSGLMKTGAALAGAGAIMLVDKPVFDYLTGNPESIAGRYAELFSHDRPLGYLGRTAVLGGISVVIYGVGEAIGSRDVRDAGAGCLSASLATSLSRNVLHLILGRSRPMRGEGPHKFHFIVPRVQWDIRSFPSGHAAHIMSCVSFWNQRYELGIAEPVLYGMALGVGMARVADGAHWPSDMYGGAAYGFAIGNAIADRYDARRRHGREPGLILEFSIPF